MGKTADIVLESKLAPALYQIHFHPLLCSKFHYRILLVSINRSETFTDKIILSTTPVFPKILIEDAEQTFLYKKKLILENTIKVTSKNGKIDCSIYWVNVLRISKCIFVQ